MRSYLQDLQIPVTRTICLGDILLAFPGISFLLIQSFVLSIYNFNRVIRYHIRQEALAVLKAITVSNYFFLQIYIVD